MRNQETGEFELVVGNRQLLSGFFIVVLLFAVAFTMGYVVGQNSPRSAKAGDAAAAPPAFPQETQPQGAPMPAPQAAPAAAPVQQTSGAAAQPVDAPPQPTTQPAREEATTPAPQAAAPQPQTAAEAPAEGPGSFWQVGSWKQEANAQALYQTLKDGGMPARLQAGTDGLVHVMVGPYRDSRSLREARDVLQTKFGVKDLYRK
jgi:cell division septation protein DedD